MEFLGVGYQELLLVLVLMLVIVGPERLPQVAYQIGRAVRQMQRYARTVRDEFGDELGYIEEQYRVVRGEVDVARTEFRRQQQEFSADVKATARDIEASVPDELKSNNNVIPITANAGRAIAPSDAATTRTEETEPQPAQVSTPAAAPGSAPAGADAKPPLLF